MKTLRYASLVAAIAAATTLFSQASMADSFDLHIGAGDTSVGIDIGTPPPAPVVEVVPAPRPGYVWAPGYWSWEGHRHVWMKGAWQPERPGYSYAPGRWEQRGNRWHFEPAHWEAGKGAEHRAEERRHDEHRAERDRHDDRHDHDYYHDHDRG